MKKKMMVLVKVAVTIMALTLYGQTVLAEENGSTQESIVTSETNSINNSSVSVSLDNSSESTSIPAENSSTDSSAANAETVASDAVTFAENKFGIVKDAPVSKTDFSSAESIREILLSDDYGITKKELDLFTNEQLLNTMTLFDRYNEDIWGMDLGAYVRLLNAMYTDHTISWEKASKMLSFVPKSFNSFSEMISHVEELQNYLQALYPKNSSFINTKTISNDELISVLKELNAIGNGPFGGGRILNIIGMIDARGTNESSSSTSTSQTEAPAASTATSSPVDTPKKDGNLPKTGEARAKLAVTIGGILIILGVIIFFFIRKNKNKK